MEFLKEILGDDLYSQVESKVNSYNSDEKNKNKQVKIVNLSEGNYVGKDKFDTKETEIINLKQQLDNANKQIDDFKEMDIDSIKKTAADYKEKFEQVQKEADIKIKEMQYDSDLTEYMKTLKINDDVHAENLRKMIKEKNLPFENGKLIGGDDVVNMYKEKYPSVFKVEEDIPNFSASTPGTNQNFVSGDPDKMDFSTYKKWREQNK